MRRSVLMILFISAFLFPGLCANAQDIPEHALRISEVMASNHQTLEDAFGRAPDWIELHNTTDSPISLKGVCVSDDKDELNRYQFPDDAIINPGEYLIVFASGAKKNIADEYHTSFKLSAAGEAVYLSRDGVILDEVLFEDQKPDISLALDANDTYQLTSTPTPGSENVITKI